MSFDSRSQYETTCTIHIICNTFSDKVTVCTPPHQAFHGDVVQLQHQPALARQDGHLARHVSAVEVVTGVGLRVALRGGGEEWNNMQGAAERGPCITCCVQQVLPVEVVSPSVASKLPNT
jgi:hypothetical protein